MTKCVVALVGDLHVNSTVALCPPSVVLDDGGMYRASKAQRYIWRHWIKYWAEVGQAREEAGAGAPLFVVINGEAADDNHHATTQLVTRNPADQLKFALLALEPVCRLLRPGDKVFVTRGTEAHSGANAALDETIARELGAEPADREMEIVSHWRLLAEFGKVRFDISHHPPGGGSRLPWARGTFANRLAAMTMWEYMEKGTKPPHLRVYGHVHNPADSYDQFPTRALVNPSWQLCTAYGHRIGGGVLPVGGSYAVCENGEYTLRKRYVTWDTGGYWNWRHDDNI